MTYAEFTANIRLNVMPFGAGEVQNTVGIYNNIILDALIDLQQKVPCLRTYHRDQHANDWQFNCGASFFPAPRGFIAGLYTVLDDDWCPKIHYEPVSEDQMRCLLDDQQECGVVYEPYDFYYEYNVYYPYGVLPYGSHYPIDVDKACRATAGVFSLIRGDLWVYPHMQDNEIAVVEWDGIKRAFADNDIIPDIWDREIASAVELKLTAEIAWRLDRNTEMAAIAKIQYDDKVAQLIWQCQKEKRLPPRAHCFTNCDC